MGFVITTSQQAPSQLALDRAQEVLMRSGCVVLPTDSVYGIGCMATPKNEGYKKIFGIKKRPATQTLPWLIADVDQLGLYGQNVPDYAWKIAQAFWPGALTLVVQASSQVPDEYRGSHNTIALRVPDSNLVRELSRRIACALPTTSANTHGAPSPTSFRELENRLVSMADLTIDGGDCPVAVCSSIVDCTDNAPKLLRLGAVDKQQIMNIYTQ